jgi:hypothetical protein
MNQPISRKAQKTATRQIVEIGAMQAAQAPIIARDPGFKVISAYRQALSDWSFTCTDVDHWAIMDRFNSDIGDSIDIAATIKEWQRWCSEIMDAIEARSKAQSALDKLNKSAGRGSMGHALQVEFMAGDLEDAQDIIARLKDGPEIDGGEGVEFDDPNYVPFPGGTLGDDETGNE